MQKAPSTAQHSVKNKHKSVFTTLDNSYFIPYSLSMVGLSKKNIATFAAECWREAQKKNPAYLPFCLPCKSGGESTYSYGIFASVASRAEYIESQKEED
jgi:hypothetical protein